MRRRRQWREHARRECAANRYAFANPSGNANAVSHASTDTNNC